MPSSQYVLSYWFFLLSHVIGAIVLLVDNWEVSRLQFGNCKDKDNTFERKILVGVQCCCCVYKLGYV